MIKDRKILSLHLKVRVTSVYAPATKLAAQIIEYYMLRVVHTLDMIDKNISLQLEYFTSFERTNDVSEGIVNYIINNHENSKTISGSVPLSVIEKDSGAFLAHDLMEALSIPVRQVSDDLQILDEVARRPDGLLIARDGQIDLVGTSAS